MVIKGTSPQQFIFLEKNGWIVVIQKSFKSLRFGQYVEKVYVLFHTLQLLTSSTLILEPKFDRRLY